MSTKDDLVTVGIWAAAADQIIETVTSLEQPGVFTAIDAGASGSAGSVDIFPATASKGKIAITATNNAGNTTTSITNAAQSGARTYTIPDAGTSASFVMTEGAQTINGTKTFSAIDADGGAIDGTPIGANAAAAGAFTTITGTSSATLGAVGGALGSVVLKGTTSGTVTATTDATATKLTVDKPIEAALNGTVGATTPAAGAFTTITGTSSATLGAVGGALGSVVLKGTTSGTVTATTDATATKLTVDKPIEAALNGTVGATTPAAGAFTTITGTSSATLGAVGGALGSVVLKGTTSGTVTATTDATATKLAINAPLAMTSATPIINFYDSDATAGDINAAITVAATTVTADHEDIDFKISVQSDGTLVDALVIDADGVIAVGYSGQPVSISGSISSPNSLKTAQLAAVAGTPTGTPSDTGGTINDATTQYAKIVAIDANGKETTVSTESAAVTTGTSGGNTNSIAWAWNAVSGAASYRIYIGATGAEANYATSTTNSYTQTAAFGTLTGGTMPTVNGTGSALVHGLEVGEASKISGAIGLKGTTSGTATISTDATAVTVTIDKALSVTGRTTMTGNVANTAGAGITGGAGTVVKTAVTKEGDLFVTRIFIDLTGLNSGGTADDIIGKNGTAACHLGQITAAVNGTIVGITMQCYETPATGDTDIDLCSGDEATGTEDAASTGLTNYKKLINGGAQTAGTITGSTAVPTANQYLYLACGAGGDATYSAGQLLITLIGM